MLINAFTCTSVFFNWKFKTYWKIIMLIIRTLEIFLQVIILILQTLGKQKASTTYQYKTQEQILLNKLQPKTKIVSIFLNGLLLQIHQIQRCRIARLRYSTNLQLYSEKVYSLILLNWFRTHTRALTNDVNESCT